VRGEASGGWKWAWAIDGGTELEGTWVAELKEGRAGCWRCKGGLKDWSWMSVDECVSSAQEVVQIFLSSSGDRSRGGGGGCEKNTGSPVVLDEPFIRRLSANAMAGVMSCS
jgi:hypothetical protein